jgi:hypothetical protein
LGTWSSFGKHKTGRIKKNCTQNKSFLLNPEKEEDQNLKETRKIKLEYN